MKPPETVVVLRFSAAGDVILTAPAIDALRKAWPKTRIVFAIKESYAGLVSHNPNVDAVLPLRKGEGVVSFARRINALAPGALLDLHGKVRSRLLRGLVRAPRKVAWQKREVGLDVPVRLGLMRYRASMRIAHRYHAAVEALVGHELPHGELRYWVGEADQRDADVKLRALGLDPSRPIVGMSPGANWETKRWPAERYGELAARLTQQGVDVVLVGSPDEAPLADIVCKAAPAAKNLVGALRLTELGGIIARCRAFVANDSGPMHLARALGVPTLAIFGCTDPAQFEFEGHGLLYAGLPCAPCHFYGRRSCPRGHFRCMTTLDVERAWTMLAPLLAPRPVRFVSA